MPSTSKKQAKFMAAVAHSPAFAKKVGVPTSVGKEFNQADKESGMKAKKPLPPFMMKKDGAKKPAMKMAKGGATRADGVVKKAHTKGKMIAMNKGGKAC